VIESKSGLIYKAGLNVSLLIGVAGRGYHTASTGQKQHTHVEPIFPEAASRG
jgi:hypothetical protein